MCCSDIKCAKEVDDNIQLVNHIDEVSNPFEGEDDVDPDPERMRSLVTD